jgi:hypothetical protein
LTREVDKRSDGRTNVFLSATLSSGAATFPVRIRNVSAQGALIDGSELPATGETVRLARGSLSVVGVIAWQSCGHCGVSFGQEIDVDTWAKRAGTIGQKRVDQVIEAVRGGMTVNESPSKKQSLQEISEALDRICDRLADSSNISVELAEEILQLDVLAQSLRGIVME